MDRLTNYEENDAYETKTSNPCFVVCNEKEKTDLEDEVVDGNVMLDWFCLKTQVSLIVHSHQFEMHLGRHRDVVSIKTLIRDYSLKMMRVDLLILVSKWIQVEMIQWKSR
jgi:hypothetical protein